MPPMLSSIPAYQAAAYAYNELTTKHKAYVAALDELVVQIRGWRGDDPIMIEYANVFNKDNIIDLLWDEKAKKEYLKERDWRFRHNIPPGYKDARKEDGGIGDFLIWKSLLSLGKKRKNGPSIRDR
jgi:hypothetical protein